MTTERVFKSNIFKIKSLLIIFLYFFSIFFLNLIYLSSTFKSQLKRLPVSLNPIGTQEEKVYIYPDDLNFDKMQTDCNKAGGAKWVNDHFQACEDNPDLENGPTDYSPYTTLHKSNDNRHPDNYSGYPHYDPIIRLNFNSGAGPCGHNGWWPRGVSGTTWQGSTTNTRAGQTFIIPQNVNKITGFYVGEIWSRVNGPSSGWTISWQIFEFGNYVNPRGRPVSAKVTQTVNNAQVLVTGLDIPVSPGKKYYLEFFDPNDGKGGAVVWLPLSHGQFNTFYPAGKICSVNRQETLLSSPYLNGEAIIFDTWHDGFKCGTDYCPLVGGKDADIAKLTIWGITSFLTPTPTVSLVPSPTSFSRGPRADIPCPQSYGGEDSFIYYEDPKTSLIEQDTNFGQEPLIHLSKGTHTLFKIGFLKFDLSSLPIEAEIKSATLRLFVVGWGGVGGGGCEAVGNIGSWGRIDLFKVTGPWRENTITWNNKPTVDYSRVISSAYVSTQLGYINFGVTNIVREWHKEPNKNYGLAISLGKDATLDNETSCKQFYIASLQSTSGPSSPWYAQPCLIIDYIVPTPIPLSFSCQDLTLDAIVPQLIPGRQVSISCTASAVNQTSGVNHFEFILRHDGRVISLGNAPAKKQGDKFVGSINYRIPDYGCYEFLCRACQSSDSSVCTRWGMAN